MPLGGECCAKRIGPRCPLVRHREITPRVNGAVFLSTVTPCFTPGTLVATDKGQRPVETLTRGDLVVTRDNGLRRIHWTGRRSFNYSEIGEEADLQPILIRRDAFGEGYPARDMIVSPTHRFLVGIDMTPLTDGADEALIAAKDLLDGTRVKQAPVLGVTYIHFLCNAHEVVMANGAWTESFHPDDRIMRNMAEPQRKELLALFPEIETIGAALRFRSARTIIRKSRFDR